MLCHRFLTKTDRNSITNLKPDDKNLPIKLKLRHSKSKSRPGRPVLHRIMAMWKSAAVLMEGSGLGSRSTRGTFAAYVCVVSMAAKCGRVNGCPLQHPASVVCHGKDRRSWSSLTSMKLQMVTLEFLSRTEHQLSRRQNCVGWHIQNCVEQGQWNREKQRKEKGVS